MTTKKKKFELKFRNYNPIDKKLRVHRMKKVARQDQTWLMGELKEVLACAVKNVDDESLTVAPKKANWDLKRDLKPRLEILQKKTERAVLEMIREKAEQQAKEAEEDSSDDDSSDDSSDDEKEGKDGKDSGSESD
jgi:coiled-coil domain-containing protein 12